MSAWDAVLGVERAVWGVVNDYAPAHFTEDDRRDWVHDTLIHLHRHVGAHDASKGRGWVGYAMVGARMVCLANLRRPSLPLYGDADPADAPITYAPRCRHCDRALRTKPEVREGISKHLEARRHSDGLCQACAKRPRGRADCRACGADFVPRHGQQRYCTDACRQRARRRQNARG